MRKESALPLPGEEKFKKFAMGSCKISKGGLLQELVKMYQPVLKPRVLLAIALTVFFIAALPVIVLVAALLFLVRSGLNWYIKVYRPDLVSLIDGCSTWFLEDNLYDAPKTVITAYQIVQDDIDPEAFALMFDRHIRNSPFCDQLQWSVSSFMGFAVWKRVSDFNVRNHVRVADGNCFNTNGKPKRWITEDELAQYAHALSKEPFLKDASPFDLTICRGVTLEGVEGTCGIIVARLHHVVGDGLSCYHIGCLMNDNPDNIRCSEETMKKCMQSSVTSRRTLGQRITGAVVAPFVGIYETLSQLVHACDYNPWHEFNSPLRTNFHYADFTVDKADVTRIRKFYDVTFVTVLFATQTAALRKYFVRHCLPVPKNMHYSFTFPMALNITRLTNSFATVCVTLPTGLNSRSEMIQEIQEEQIKLKRSGIPIVSMTFLQCFLGLLPTIILKRFHWKLTTGVCTNMPGMDRTTQIGGKDVLRQGFVVTLRSNLSLRTWCFGYNGKVHVNLGVSDDIMPDKRMVEELAKMMQEEFEILKTMGPDEIVPLANDPDGLSPKYG